MIFQIVLIVIFAGIVFGLGFWSGRIKTQDEFFGKLMEEGKTMIKLPNHGWEGHPDAYDEIIAQKHNLPHKKG